MEETKVSIAERYKKLSDKRQAVLERARECAKLTIPSLMPPDGYAEDTALYKPFQSLGARGVNNLASKLMLTLLPPNTPFFKFTIDPVDIALGGQSEEQVNHTLAEMENVLMRDIEVSGDRVAVFQMLRLLIVTGNALMYFPEKKEEGVRVKVYRLDSYVVLRDPMGNILEIIIHEKVASRAIPNEALRAKIQAKMEKEKDSKTHVDLYTRIVLDKKTDKWQVTQEAYGEEFSDGAGEYPKGELPYIALRWSALPSEDYGRSHADDAIGDLRGLEGLRQALQEGASASSKVLFFVDPNGTTRSVDVAEAENLEVIEGRADEVSVLQVQKNADLATVKDTINDLKQDLAYHFLLNSSIQRHAERVTAEEIRTMATELEDSLGGTYTVLSMEFQMPYVKLRMLRLRAENSFPEGTEKIEPMITTGLEGLGRGHDFNKINTFISGVKALGPKAEARINYGYILGLLASASGFKADDVVLGDEVVQQASQQEQVMGLMDKAIGPASGKLAEMMMQST